MSGYTAHSWEFAMSEDDYKKLCLVTDELLKTSIVYWHKPSDIKPTVTQTILVFHNSTVYAGVYNVIQDNVILYPEDFVRIPLDDCDLWTALPSPAESD